MSKSKEILYKIKEKENLIYTLKEEILSLKKECIHDEYAPVYVETFAFEFTPRYQCIGCGLILDNIFPTYDEKLTLLKDFYADIDIEPSDKIIAENINGFNI